MKNTKPLIKLFKTPLGFYCYDVNTFSMLRITEGMYNILNSKEQYGDGEDRIRISKLYENGYLSNHRAKEMKHPYTEFLNEYMAHNIRKITLQITQNCNLACKYCAYANPIEGKQRSHTNKSMPLDIAMSGVDFIFEHSKNVDSVNIGFYGGEPMLEFEKVKAIMEYAKSQALIYKKDITFSITTNATIFTDEIVEYFLVNDINILISLDGPKDIHNKNRIYRMTGKGCFDDVMRNIDHIRHKYPDFMNQISINAVIDTENDFLCYDAFLTGYESIEGIRATTNAINKTLLANNFSSTEPFAVCSRYEKFKFFLASLNIISMDNVSPIVSGSEFDIKEIAKSFRSSMRLVDITHHSGPCIAGAVRLLMDIDGKFFPCERCSENSKVMNIGDIKDGFNIEAIKNLINIGKLTENECINCWNIQHCKICGAQIDNISDLSRSKKLERCTAAKNNTYNIIKDYLMLLEQGYDYNQMLIEEN